MSKKEFTEHLNQFMEYMRKMEESMSQNWDILFKFQKDLMDTSNKLINKMTEDERIFDLKSVVKDIQDQLKVNEKSNKDTIGAMMHLRNEIKSETLISLHEIGLCHQRILKELRSTEENLKQFSKIDAESMATRGAKKALNFVKEYKEAKVFMQSVKNIIDSDSLNKMESLTGISYHPDLDVSILECQFSCRTQNILRYANLETMSEIFATTKKEILKYRNAGKKTITEIDKWFKIRDLDWS